jgi:hypothetical protein
MAYYNEQSVLFNHLHNTTVFYEYASLFQKIYLTKYFRHQDSFITCVERIIQSAAGGSKPLRAGINPAPTHVPTPKR